MQLSLEEQKQYSRHLLLDEIGTKGQLKLKQAKVLVIGAGGLSCPLLQYLAAAGTGTIGIVDNDNVDQTNLQRQVLYTTADIGANKAHCAAERLRLLNPFILINSYSERLTKSNVLELFDGYDIIVDGTDNFATRYLINDAAVLLEKPVVFGSIFKFEGQVAVFNYENGPTYRCLYPTPPKPDESPNCSEIGVLGVLPGIIGTLQANEVLKMILKSGNILTGKLLTFNALTMQQMIFTFEKNTALSITSLAQDYQEFCGVPKNTSEISFEAYQKQAFHYNILDVRTQTERNEYAIDSMHIPLDQLTERFHEVPVNKDLVVYCKSGKRSHLAIEILQNNNFPKALFNLKNGLPKEIASK